MAGYEHYDQRVLIRALVRDDRLFAPADRVEVKETHLSWVVLAGEHVYKIKKAVRLDFVDFSTLERRRAACYEELRLNHRFAPQLYLDAVGIGGSPQAPVLNARNDVFEYAVRLRRFQGNDELCALIEHKAVTTAELARFGTELARIHQASTVCERGISAQRTFDTVRRNMRELERMSRSFTHDVAALENWFRHQWRQVANTAADRCATGRVRECHGDLHAGNVVRLEDRLLAFDCIEFSADLRCIDVINDVAFLVMDLIARGAGALAFAFLNGWLEESGDYAGVTLLRFFAVYRALVRAKVSALGHDESQARRYVSTAQRLTQPRRPMLVITCGLSGSGKTWLSSRLLGPLQLIRVRSDVERKRMAGLRAEESSRSLRNQKIYSIEFNERVYALLQSHARTLIEAGENVIIDAAFLKSHERLAFIELARQLNTPVRILHCVATAEVMEHRLRERQRAGKDASEADVAVMTRQLGAWEPFTEAEHEAIIDVRTADESSVAKCQEALRAIE